MAGVIKGMLRQEDVAARLGVAKFALLLIETDQQGTERVIERLHQSIANTDFEISDKVTISIGSASPVIDEDLNFADIRSKAEEAFEEAVAKGPAQTVFAKYVDANKLAEAQKKGPKIDISAVLREVEKNNGKRLGEKQLNAALNSVLPLLSFLNDKMSLDLEEVITKLNEKVIK